MILIGMFDSPFVRRVAVSMKVLGMNFEHRNWSVGADFERIREYNPLGQVPTLVLDDGEVLVESAAILDYLDDSVTLERALLPRSGTDRHNALQWLALAIGAAEKGRTMIYERAFRPENKQHEPWVARCRNQLHSTLDVLEQRCRARAGQEWLLGERLLQPDITLGCVLTFLLESEVIDQPERYAALLARAAKMEAQPEFVSTYDKFCAPRSPQ